jgi:hypothetical protein
LRHRKIAFLSVIGAAAVLVAQQSVTEAPAGFTTPTLGLTVSPTGELTGNPGTQSVSNGIAEPRGDTFALDQAQFERRHDPSTGLGPVFNGTACVECHNNGVAGAARQFTELRVGLRNGNFVNPAVLINSGANTITGRSIINDRSICAQAQEHVPDAEDIRTLRAVLNTLGDGFVEAVDDRTFLAIAANQPFESRGEIHGEAIQVPIFEAPGLILCIVRVSDHGLLLDTKNAENRYRSFHIAGFLEPFRCTTRSYCCPLHLRFYCTTLS